MYALVISYVLPPVGMGGRGGWGEEFMGRIEHTPKFSWASGLGTASATTIYYIYYLLKN